LLDFLYFSAITITTVGFGDIVPNSQFVRFVVIVETLLGIVLIGVFVSRLLA
jgi:voltage-gated potassium channel